MFHIENGSFLVLPPNTLSHLNTQTVCVFVEEQTFLFHGSYVWTSWVSREFLQPSGGYTGTGDWQQGTRNTTTLIILTILAESRNLWNDLLSLSTYWDNYL